MRRDLRAPHRQAPGEVAPGVDGEARERASPRAPLTLLPPTGFLLHPSAPLHDPGWGHPEHQGRLPAIATAVERALPVLHGKVEPVEARFATLEELTRVHPRGYLERIEAACRQADELGAQVEVGQETPVSGGSWDAIRGSSGAAIVAVEGVIEGTLRNAFVAARPPGHHASAGQAMGFCPVNHVALAARHLQSTGAAERIAIVDWDVHHGNGTQDIFLLDPTVFFLSLHQFPFYPGTGSAEERGVAEGLGTTLNVPLPARTTGKAYRQAFTDAITQAEGAFAPDLILISAGFDAMAGDPIGGMLLEPGDFFELARTVMGWAERACSGRVVALLEGGYHPARTGQAVAATLAALAGLEGPPEV
ncbi:MAG: histone deacetylase [Gemmatimonadetes bacterium]|nr:histone deacetylase [Gemmatimonadota bacterium]